MKWFRNGQSLTVNPPTFEEATKKWRSADKKRISLAAIDIINHYTALGIPLGVRQVCYILESRGIIPKSAFERVGDYMTELRKLGVIAIDVFKDNTRFTKKFDTEYIDPVDQWNRFFNHIKELDRHYDLPKWWGQPYHVEVWCEAKGVAATLEVVCDDLGIVLKPLGGQDSITEQWDAIRRLQRYEQGESSLGDAIEKKLVILYIGDHDPSGIAIQDKAKNNVTANDWVVKLSSGSAFVQQTAELHTFKRVAVTMQQVKDLGLSANPTPANRKDSNWKAYVGKFKTTDTWEADAIEPVTLGRIVRDEILAFWDTDAESDRDLEQEVGRATIRTQMKRNGIEPAGDGEGDAEEGS